MKKAWITKAFKVNAMIRETMTRTGSSAQKPRTDAEAWREDDVTDVAAQPWLGPHQLTRFSLILAFFPTRSRR